MEAVANKGWNREASYWTIEGPSDEEDSSIVLRLTLDRGQFGGENGPGKPEARLDCGHLRESALRVANGALLCLACSEGE